MKIFIAILFSALAVLATSAAPLREVYKPYFKLGVALNVRQVMDPVAGTLAVREFSSATAENCMKAAEIQPKEGVFNWKYADEFVAFCERGGMKPIGHCLVWHSQPAEWMFTGPDGKPASRELLLRRLYTHVKTVVGRYKGRVKGWDVVNEAFDGKGELSKTKWRELIGPDYIELAFRMVHRVDPDAELYYNDFGMDGAKKRDAVCAMIRNLKAKGIRIDGVGMQTHVNLKHPDLKEFEKSIEAFAAEGVKVMITEMDISVLPAAWNVTAEISTRYDYDEKYNPYRNALPEAVADQLARRYCDFFSIYLRHAGDIDRVTVWGLEDGGSWLNDFPVNGRTDYPLLYDRALKPKLCRDALERLPVSFRGNKR